MQKDDKIIFIGNIANNFSRMASLLYQNNFSDVQLLIDIHEDATNKPFNDPIDKANTFFSVSKDWKLRNLINPKNSNLRSKVRDCDYLITSSTNVLCVFFAKKTTKVIFYATGADLTIFPFVKRHIYARFKSSNQLHKLFFIVAIPKYVFLSILMKLALKKVWKIYASPFPPFLEALNELRISGQRRGQGYLPLAIDQKSFKHRSNPVTKLGLETKRILDDYDLIIFAPSRIMIDSNEIFTKTGQYKGQEKLLNCFATVLQNYPNLKPVIIFISRLDLKSDAEDQLREIVVDLDLEKNVLFLSSGNDLLSRDEMVDFYSLADIVFDEFGAGWFGSVSLEAMSCECPVICKINNDSMAQLYPSHTFINFQNEGELESRLAEIFQGDLKLAQIGKDSRKWIEKHHSQYSISKFFSDLQMEKKEIL